MIVLLHGILGSKANWNTPAKKLLERAGSSGWRVLQIDHRCHGQSLAGEAPHSIDACAEDVLETLVDQGVQPDVDEIIMCGHSFGGKVALTATRIMLDAGKAPPVMTWLFDSIPGEPAKLSEEDQRKEQSVSFVLDALRREAGQRYADRNELISELIERQGLTSPVAQWVAQSMRSVDGGVELSYDMEIVHQLYEAYRSTDLWHVIEGGRARVGVVVAGRNRHAWGKDNIDRLHSSGAHVVVLEKAGHNVHVDDLPGLLVAFDKSFENLE